MDRPVWQRGAMSDDPSPDTASLTELQVEILEILWSEGEAGTALVRDRLAPDRELALSTVATLLSRLAKKGVVVHRRRGRQFIYRPTVSRSEVRRSMVSELTRSLFGGDAAALVQHLVAAHEVDGAELDRIRALIDEAEARQG